MTKAPRCPAPSLPGRTMRSHTLPAQKAVKSVAAGGQDRDLLGEATAGGRYQDAVGKCCAPLAAFCAKRTICVCASAHAGRVIWAEASSAWQHWASQSRVMPLATSALTQLGSTRGLTQHCFLEAETVLEPLWPTAPVLSGWHLHQSSCRNQTLGSCRGRGGVWGGLSSPPNPHQQLFPCLFSSTHPSSALPHHRCHPPLLQATITSPLDAV